MDKCVVLLANGGGAWGYGHLHRTLAVAEELRQREVPVVWWTHTPKEVRQLLPPCPVEWCPDWGRAQEWAGVGRVLYLDLAEQLVPPVHVKELLVHSNAVHLLAMVDGPEEWAGAELRVAPHFGAEAWTFLGMGAVATGPQWMPLRRSCFLERPSGGGYESHGNLLLYRAPVGLNHLEGVRLPTHRPPEGGAHPVAWWRERWRAAVVPASTIAYECMSAGVPVLLREGYNQQIAEAMVAANVAMWCTDHLASRQGGSVARRALKSKAERAKEAVDGKGVERVVDLLVEGLG